MNNLIFLNRVTGWALTAFRSYILIVANVIVSTLAIIGTVSANSKSTGRTLGKLTMLPQCSFGAVFKFL